VRPLRESIFHRTFLAYNLVLDFVRSFILEFGRMPQPPQRPMRSTKSKEQIERERKHWLCLPSRDQLDSVNNLRKEKREVYLSAFREAPSRHVKLSDMQWYVAYLLSHGKSLKEMASNLGISVGRVSDIQSDIRRKVPLKDAAEIGRWFLGF
jgi:DNA-binding CsgD family transcriptional regulator